MNYDDIESYLDDSVRTVTLKLDNVNDADLGPLHRTQGAAKLRSLVELITMEDLVANPRRPKKTAITSDIIDTLQTFPEMMPYFSKGLLIGASVVEKRERSRYQLFFYDEHREGVLDGGHNLMAIALSILAAIGVSDAQLRKIKFWDDLKKCWEENIRTIEAWKREDNDPLLDTYIPVEIVSPRVDADEETSVTEFNNLILQICANRNQNAQLAADAIANQSGVFDVLKEALPRKLSNAVRWSTNDHKRIDPRMLVSLVWVSLGKVPTLEDYDVTPLPPTSAYSAKAESLSRFTKLIESDAAKPTKDGKSYELRDTYVASAIKMIPEILQCHDIIYEGYQDAYNGTGGKFGGISAVKKASKGKNYTLASNKLVDHDVPPSGFLMPVVYSLQALIKVDKENEELSWLVDPVEFFSNKENLQSIVAAVRPVMEMVNWNPQTVGKNAASYNAAYDKARNMVLEAMFG